MQVLLSLRVMQVLLSVALRGQVGCASSRLIHRFSDSGVSRHVVDFPKEKEPQKNLASQALVDRFFCDAAAMRLRFGCDAKRESLCEMIDVITLC